MTGSSFKFRLERVRSLRERREDEAKEALAGAMHSHRLCEQRVEEAAADVARAREAQLQTAGGPTPATEMLFRQSFLERTERQQAAVRQDLERQAQQLEQRRQELLHAARERQALERLKERRRADHERELARRESIALDEIAITGFRRRAA